MFSSHKIMKHVWGEGGISHGKCKRLKLVLGAIFRMDHLLCDRSHHMMLMQG